MRYVTGIEVDRAIVHLIDPRRSSTPTLSQQALPLAANAALASYFSAHIESSLADATARAARFADLSSGLAAQACCALFAADANLVPASQHLASHLHDIMARDGRISGGDLAVCLYRTADHPNLPYYLALLKIDASRVLRPRTVDDGHGTVYVDFDVLDDALPTARERLQKCAFIQPLQPRPEYDMILLDRQNMPGRADTSVARFFIDDFMGARPAFDARESTSRLYRGLVSAQNELRGQLSAGQNETLHTAIEQAIASTKVNVDMLIESLPLDDAQRARVDAIVSELLPDREIEIDATYKDGLLRRRIFRGDHDLRLSVRADHFSEVIQSVERIDDGNGPARWQIVIQTEKWDEVAR